MTEITARSYPRSLCRAGGDGHSATGIYFAIKAFKLLRQRRDGSLGPLFINQRQRIPLGEWLEAEEHPTKGYAFRPGWHCLPDQYAPHLSTKGRVWCGVTLQDVTSYQRPAAQGGLWYTAKYMRVDVILRDQ